MYYSLKYLKSKFSFKNNIFNLLKSKEISLITLSEPINNLNSVDKIKSFQPDLLVEVVQKRLKEKLQKNSAK